MDDPRLPYNTPLGNFLSGMETRIRYPEFYGVRHLGNFLSGMETRFRPIK